MLKVYSQTVFRGYPTHSVHGLECPRAVQDDTAWLTAKGHGRHRLTMPNNTEGTLYDPSPTYPPPGSLANPTRQAPAPLLSDPLGPPLPINSFFQITSPDTETLLPTFSAARLDI